MLFFNTLHSLGVVRFILFSFFFLMPWVEADAVNRTIDDTFGDSVTKQQVVYVPATGAWHDATCLLSSGCAIVADPSQCFSNTYTAATYRSPQETSITMQFNGTAIYVFFILANNMGDGITTLTIANFTLDDNQPQLYIHQPDPNTKDLDYNQLVYSQKNLTNTQHTLVISTSGLTFDSYLNFDYAIYTHEDGSSSPTTATSSTQATTSAQTNSKKSTPVGAIVGGVIGGLAVLFALVVLFFVIRRRRLQPKTTHFDPSLMVEANPTSISQSPPRPSGSVDPFMTPQSSQSPGIPTGHVLTPVRSGIHSPQNSISTNSKAYAARSPTAEVAYGGIVDNSSSSGRADTVGNTELNSSSSGLAYNSNRHLPLVSVTTGDHLSAPNSNLVALTSRGKDIEAIRQARQRELDERLSLVQQEMATLASEISNDRATRQNSAHNYIPVRTQQGAASFAAGEGEGTEMNLDEMKVQLRIMRERIDTLTAQQQSPWAQGLSDDPPPGYTTTWT